MTIMVRWAEPADDVVVLQILPAEGRTAELRDLLPEEEASLGIRRHQSWFGRLFGAAGVCDHRG